MKKEIIQESGELIFLRYSHSVIGYCGKARASENELLEFEEILKNGGFPSRTRLEELFPDAVKHLKSWSQKDVRDYWLCKHNKIVEGNDWCKVYGFRVFEVLPPDNGEICRVKLIGISRITPKSYIPLQPGDLVTMHSFGIAEKLQQEVFDRYFKK